MIDRLDEIKKKALASLEAAKTDSEIEEIYISTLGRNGKLTEILRGMGKLSKEMRAEVGKMANKENSVRGWKGVLKKLGYWLMIMVAFGASAIFIEIGKAIGVDLGITTLLGWFVLASLLINEIRSILENFVEAGFNVPIILIKGLEVADKVVNKDGDSEGE